MTKKVTNRKGVLKFNTIIIPCFLILIVSSCGNKKKPDLPSEITFTEHVAPVIHKNCTPCHRPGQAGPFSLITYQDVLRKAATIQIVVTEKFMPPWPADPEYSHFIGEKVLSEYDIALIDQWIHDGCKPGIAGKSTAPEFNDTSSFGKPDLTLRLSKPYFIEGNNKDYFLAMKLPFEIPNDTFIKAIEFIPGNRKVVHHMNAHIVNYDQPEKKKNIFDGEETANIDSMDNKAMHETIGLPYDDGTYPTLTPSVCNYLPGMENFRYPEGIGGYRLAKKAALYLNSMHYGATPVDQYDHSGFNIYFADKKPERAVKEFILGTIGVSKVEPPLIIPADSVKKFITKYILDKDISVLTVIPHMHLLGKSFLAYAVKPGGDTIPVIRIKKWDFRWQYFYTFRKAQVFPKGTLLVAEGVYDNTMNNPNNPYFPPKIIYERSGSMRTTDEMFQLIVMYIDYKTGDEELNLENPVTKR